MYVAAVRGLAESKTMERSRKSAKWGDSHPPPAQGESQVSIKDLLRKALSLEGAVTLEKIQCALQNEVFLPLHVIHTLKS